MFNVGSGISGVNGVNVAPIVHCVRHAQGYHNLSIANHALHDPSLTPYGEEQCRRLNQYFPDHQNVELLVASPIRRTIYTTLLSFEPGVKRGLKVIALPELQETSDLPCDTGSDLATLHKEFHDQPVDLSLVHTGWNSKTGKWAPDAEAIATRCREARQWLKSRPEKEIVVVTHGGFLHYLTEDWTGSSKFRGLSTAFSIGTGWANCETRSYAFADETSDNASLQETSESKERRRGSEKPLSKTEQMELRQTTHKTWEQSGYQIQTKV